MKKIITILLVILYALNINAQIEEPIEWAYKVEKISESKYELYMLAIIEKPWHLYGQYFEDGGPIKLKFEFIENNNYTLIDSVLETPKPHIVRDDIFDIDVQYFTKKVLFTQKVEIKRTTEIIVMIEGQVCDDKTGRCLMVTDEHVFMLK